jgi:hypothetical protein
MKDLMKKFSVSRKQRNHTGDHNERQGYSQSNMSVPAITTLFSRNASLRIAAGRMLNLHEISLKTKAIQAAIDSIFASQDI